MGGGGHPEEAVAYLRRVAATPAQIPDEDLVGAGAVLHVASPSAALVTELCAELKHLMGSEVTLRVLRGVVGPTQYTGNLMHEFAYAQQMAQQPGAVAPHAFLLPLSKTDAWWSMDWMERHTYFLPRYDGSGRRVHEGHALAAAEGVPHLMRRTYKAERVPAPAGEYDFLTYFECSDAGVPVFHRVCAALRDPDRNPEWCFVREGPKWHGRRVRDWEELFG